MARCRGKTAATYQPSMDMGSYVVIINAEKVKVTGNKEQQKMYYRHTGRPGSLKEENFKKLQAVSGAGFSHAQQKAGRGADFMPEWKACLQKRWAPRWLHACTSCAGAFRRSSFQGWPSTMVSVLLLFEAGSNVLCARCMQRLPERIVEKAVKGMLPSGRIGRHLFTHLKVLPDLLWSNMSSLSLQKRLQTSP